jgi:hypothetical protein
VWTAAQADGRFLVTQDLDFSDARKYAPGTHHGLLLVRLPQPGRTALFERVSTLFRTEAVGTVASSRQLPGRSASRDLSEKRRFRTERSPAFYLASVSRHANRRTDILSTRRVYVCGCPGHRPTAL